MALQLPLPEVPESRQYNSAGNQQASFLIVPGVSDYVTGGYVITALQCRMKNIFAVSIDGQNAAVLTGQWNAFIQLNATASASGLALPVTSFNFWVALATSGVQLSASTNLTGAIWTVSITGY
jgi:hypothetical protein